jgi:Tol biopolymer transport system component
VAQPIPAGPPPIAIVTSESGPQGARLVAIDEHGDRRFDLLQPATSLARDSHPAISPDGRWIVFASSRGRTLDTTSLWIAPLVADAEPARLTTVATAIDSHPVWTRDGTAILFASTRDGGDFDLYRLAIEAGRAIGEPQQLTSGAGHEITPTVAADGTVIYAAVTPLAGGGVDSHLEARAPDGTITKLTDGPGDASPALTPDDRTIAFARPQQHPAGVDGDLWTMPRNSDQATPLIDLPLTDESGPVWSRDGRYVFATSVLRGAAGNTVFSSVIVIDTRGTPRKARLLADRTGAVARLTPAVAQPRLDAAALASDPEYLPELARIMAAAMAQHSEDAPSDDSPSEPVQSHQH